MNDLLCKYQHVVWFESGISYTSSECTDYLTVLLSFSKIKYVQTAHHNSKLLSLVICKSHYIGLKQISDRKFCKFSMRDETANLTWDEIQPTRGQPGHWITWELRKTRDSSFQMFGSICHHVG